MTDTTVEAPATPRLKVKYNEKIKAREARRNQSTAEIKEIRFRLKIDGHDFDVKKGHVVRFLNGGDKVKVTIMLRGREQSRPIGGVELLQRLASEVEEYGTVEFAPKQEGRNIIMTLAPKGKKVHTQSEQRRRGAESRAERRDDGGELVVAVDLVGAGFFDVEHLAPERQNGLKARVAPLRGRAAGAVALDDVELCQRGVAVVAVAQLVGHLSLIHISEPTRH